MDNSKRISEKDELRSEKVRDLLNETPSALTLWGVIVIVLLFTVVVVIAWSFTSDFNLSQEVKNFLP